MSSRIESVDAHRLNCKSNRWFDVLFGLLPLMMLAPLLAEEFQLLWLRVGMRFSPIPICIVAGIAAWHMRSHRTDMQLRVIAARGVFLLGVLAFGSCVWQFSPWLAHGCLVLFFTSWAVERFGEVAWPRVAGWSVLLATSMRMPGDLDSQLQRWLFTQSSASLSTILDGLAIPFLIQADTLSMQGLSFSLRECCDSVFSIHALASAVVLLLLLCHRSLLVAVISLLTLPLWVVIQNVLLLLTVVLLKHYGNRDASQGIDSMLVALAVFGMVLISSWLASWFLAKLLQPVPAADNEFEPEFLLLNSMLCWPQPDPFLPAFTARIQNPTMPSAVEQFPAFRVGLQQVCLLGCVGVLALGLFSTQRWIAGRSADTVSKLPGVDTVLLGADAWRESIPKSLGPWSGSGASFETLRENGSERAAIQWQFAWQGQVVQLSVTLPFNRRPRLATKYEAKGWRVLGEQIRQVRPNATHPETAGSERVTSPDTPSSQAWTELSITNELGGRAHAIAAYFPLADLALDGQVASGESQRQEHPLEYQVILFCESGEELTKPQLAELYAGFQLVNEQLQKEAEPRLRELLGGER